MAHFFAVEIHKQWNESVWFLLNDDLLPVSKQTFANYYRGWKFLASKLVSSPETFVLWNISGVLDDVYLEGGHFYIEAVPWLPECARNASSAACADASASASSPDVTMTIRVVPGIMSIPNPNPQTLPLTLEKILR